MTKQEIYYKIKVCDASFKAYITEFFNVVNSYFLLGDSFLNVAFCSSEKFENEKSESEGE